MARNLTRDEVVELWDRYEAGETGAQLARRFNKTPASINARIIKATGPSHDPHPRCPASGLLRQYFPRGTDLKPYTQTDLDNVAAQLNGRPRKTLDFVTPSQKFAEAVATTG